jgi:hypothetical protein
MKDFFFFKASKMNNRLILAFIVVACGAVVLTRFRKNQRKFFKECFYSDHVDHRFCGVKSRHPAKLAELRLLLQKFVIVCEQKNIRPFLWAGGLIGWKYNKLMLPWDDDLDMQILPEDVPKIVLLDGLKGDGFFIEVNPNWSKCQDPQNMIDARVISSNLGVFIDITFLQSVKDDPEAMTTKFGIQDKVKTSFIRPLQRSRFEDVDVWVPANPEKTLVSRYGHQVLRSYGHGPPGMERRSWSFQNGSWSKTDNSRLGTFLSYMSQR